MKNTRIEWAHHTVNFWWGCTFARYLDGSVRDECIHCYAKRLAAFFAHGRATWGEDGKRWIRADAAVTELMALDASARKRGVRERVFVNSMSDTFEDRSELNDAREILWIACGIVTNLDILLLTKRPEHVMDMVPLAWHVAWPAHVWIGTTCGTQKAADEAVPELLEIPAKVRFLSIEPLTEAVVLRRKAADSQEIIQATLNGALDDYARPVERGIHWVIVGGESGPGARPVHPDWVRSLRDQCAAAGVPFFFKQWGEWLARSQLLLACNSSAAKELLKRQKSAVMRRDSGIDPSLGEASTSNDADSAIYRVGKKAAGRLLDGVEHNAVPGAEKLRVES